MTGKHLLLWFFPPPRRPVTARTAMPLALFVTVFVLGCLLLDALNLVLFAAPRAFALILLAPWFWWMHLGGYSGLTGWRSAAALLSRLMLLGLFIVLLAQPRAVRRHDTLSMLFALDVSASIDQQAADQALRYIATVATDKPQKDQVGLVAFGRDAAVELPPEVSFPFSPDELAITLQVNRDGTNLARALSLSAAMLPDDAQGRIVLISDGSETEGDLNRALEELKSRQIAVDVLGIEYSYEHEVWLERLELPRFTKVGESYEAAVILSSLQDGEGTLVLQENGQVIFREPVTYQAGKNRFVIPIYLRDAGYYEYEATIEPHADRDGIRRNNKAISYLYLKGEGRILVVTDPAGDPRDWQTLVRTLQAEHERTVEVIDAYQFPGDALPLLPYDCIIFANVPAEAFAPNQFAALHDTVKNQGAGFLMIGGDNSFGPGGYHRTEVEEILPVTMDITQKKVLPKSALAITLHTCEFPEGNTWAKRITKQAIKVLGAQDEVGVLIYDYQGGEKWLFPLTPAAQYNEMATKINSAQIGDMPSFVTTMELAIQGLDQSDAAVKHMIIISDGDPQPPSPALLQKFIDRKISITTVAVFPHGNDVQTMQMIAQATGGRFYFPQDANLLPAIFIKEAKTLKRSMIQNKTFTPQVEFPDTSILKGISALPQLHGYVLTSPKNRSTTILKGPETEEVNPVLSTWRFGVGKTAAFTSDLAPNWARDWMQWDRYRAFVTQLVIDISRVNTPSFLRMQSFAAGNQGVVVIEDYAEQGSFLELQSQVAGPDSQTRRIELRQVGPRRYEGRFDLWGEGRYQIMAMGAGDGRDERVLGGFVVPYSSEFLRFRANPIVLAHIAEVTGGRMLTGEETGRQLYEVPRENRRSSRPIIDWFLVALAIMVPLDVALRRVHLDMAVIRGWLGIGRVAPSAETFSTLLQRKKQVAGSLQSSQASPKTHGLQSVGLDETHGPKIKIDPAAAPHTRTKTPADLPPTPPAESTSTTERLLALKRKRREPPETK